jgi:hypothetical protein
VGFWWLIDPHHYRLAPAAGGLAPAFWVGLAGFLVDMGAHPADCNGGTAVTLVRRYELDAAVTVAVVVPVHKCRYPLACLRLAGERPAGVIRSILTAPRDCVYKVWNSDSE